MPVRVMQRWSAHSAPQHIRLPTDLARDHCQLRTRLADTQEDLQSCPGRAVVRVQLAESSLISQPFAPFRSCRSSTVALVRASPNDFRLLLDCCRSRRYRVLLERPRIDHLSCSVPVLFCNLFAFESNVLTSCLISGGRPEVSSWIRGACSPTPCAGPLWDAEPQPKRGGPDLPSSSQQPVAV